MSQKSKIEWTDATWNPVRGCSRVSEGCRNCYAERMEARTPYGSAAPSTDEKFAILWQFSGPRWTGKVELIESKLDEPLHWKKPRRIFVNSMSDLFHESLLDEAIDRVFAVMAPVRSIRFRCSRRGRNGCCGGPTPLMIGHMAPPQPPSWRLLRGPEDRR